MNIRNDLQGILVRQAVGRQGLCSAAVTLFLFLWSPYGIGQTIVFLPCGFFFFVFLFSSPNLSRRRLDVCHTSTHGVA